MRPSLLTGFAARQNARGMCVRHRKLWGLFLSIIIETGMHSNFMFHQPLELIWLRFCCVIPPPSEPRKEKTDTSSGGNNGALSPSGDQSQQLQRGEPHATSGAGAGGGSGGGGAGNQTPKPERPNSLGQPNKISRRVICYHGEHCKCNIVCLFWRL